MESIRLVVINDLDILWTIRCPAKAHAKLIIDPNAVQGGEFALQRLQSVAGRDSKVIDAASAIQHRQLPHRHGLDLREALDAHPVEQALRVPAFEGPDGHARY